MNFIHILVHLFLKLDFTNGEFVSSMNNVEGQMVMTSDRLEE